MAFDFTGKKILVTGAGRGIGRAIALGLEKAGGKVYALDCNQELLESLTAENPNITTIVQDLADWDGTRRALQKLDCLDGLVNNAGILLGFKPALDHTKEELDKYMAVNVLAAINCIQVQYCILSN